MSNNSSGSGLTTVSLLSSVSLLIGCGVVFVSVLTFFLWQQKRKNSPKTLLDATIKYQLPLAVKHEISHDTKLFRFALPSPRHCLGLPIGKHIQITAECDGSPVVRSYTPISLDNELGYVDLLVKVYYRNVHPNFPNGGKMSQYLDALKIGETISVRGPLGRIWYRGRGCFEIKVKNDLKEFRVRTISMIAGGSGITPMFQIIKYALADRLDRTRLALLYANQTEPDILLRQELDLFSEQFPDRFTVSYTIDRPTPDWKFNVGFIDEKMIAEHLFGAGNDDDTNQNIVLMCGPKPMIKYACLPNLKKLNYNDSLIFEF